MSNLMMREILMAGVPAFTIIFISGFVLHKRSKQYPTLLLTVHKLVALGILIYSGWQIHLTGGIQGLNLPLLISGSILFVVLIASGGFLSAKKPTSIYLIRVHQIVPWLALAVWGWFMYSVFWIDLI